MPLEDQLDTALATFKNNVASVQTLMRFDSHVLEFVEQHLESLNKRLIEVHGAENSRLNVSNTLAMLRNIRKADSLEQYYREMLNQCVVLLVSYFSSAAGDLFRAGIVDAVKTGRRQIVLDQEIKIPLGALSEIAVEKAGDLLLAFNRDINLQNMQSIAKTFGDYFKFKRDLDEITNDIIFSHACRHVIVHCGGVADRRLANQSRSAHPRMLKPDPIVEGDRVQFTDVEILRVAECMTCYLGDLALAVAS